MIFYSSSSDHMNSTKSKITRLIICSFITFIFTLPFHYFFQIATISELRPASALPPVFGMMFGPWGAIGAAIGNLASDIMLGYSPEIFVVGFFITFINGYIAYKLWYTLDFGEHSFPRLDTVKNLMKFVVVIFITSLIMAGLLGFLLEIMGLTNLASFTTMILAFNDFDFPIMLGTLIITVANLYGISMYKPGKAKRVLIPPRVFDVVLVIAILLGSFYVLYSLFAGTSDEMGLVMGIIFYLLVAVYIFKPVTVEVKEKTRLIKMSLTEKLIVIFITIGAIIAIVTVIMSYLTISTAEGADIEFWEYVYLHITLIVAIFYISSIAFLWYIEKNITTPIESISDILRNYISDSEGIVNGVRIASMYEQYSTKENEVGILASSLKKMTDDLKAYMKNLKTVTAEKERINTELNVAKEIQADMLPRTFPAFPERDEFDVYGINIPAKEVGGDFYDFFLIDDDHLAIVIADVSGKGVPAALFMVISKTLIKTHAQLGKSPEEVFTTVNNQLYEGNSESMFVTAWMGVLEISTGKFTYTNAGHNLPLIKHVDEDYDWLKSESGFVLAGIEDMEYHQNEITLKQGDRVYLYTDGVTEAMNVNDELFGDSRLLKIINSEKNLIITEILSNVKEKIDSFAGDVEQSDDITMLMLEYKNNG